MEHRFATSTFASSEVFASTSFNKGLMAVAVGLVTFASFATAFGPSTDMATLNDYYHYAGSSGNERAVHQPNAGGWYSLSADRVWSALSVSTSKVTSTEDPVCFNLGGHTLTVTGCDTSYHPFSVSGAGLTCVLSNGTINAVTDKTTYPQTSGMSYATAVSVQKGATLIVEKDATLVHDAGTATLSFSGDNNKVIVRDGGTVNAKYQRSGSNNRWVFEKGAKWPAISNYISNGNFPNSIWYESGDKSNLFEICSSEFLTRYGITSFNVAAYEKAGSYHCGLVFRSTDFDFSMGGQTVGDGPAPVLFEVRDGAKLTMSGELWIVHATNASHSVVNVDGAGTVLKQTGQWGGRIGTTDRGTTFDPDYEYAYHHGLLRVTNGARLDFSTGPASFSIGYGRNCNYHTLELLSGSSLTNGALIVGKGNNCGNTLRVDGTGSVASVAYLNVGRETSEGGGSHQVIVSNGGKLVTRSSGLSLGEASANCLLNIDGGTVSLVNDLGIGGTNSQGASFGGNSVYVKNGSLTVANQFLLRSKDARVVVSNGTMTAKQFHFPQSTWKASTGVELTLSGRSAHVVASDWGIQVNNNAKVRFVVPKNGYASAPLDASAASYVGLFDQSTVEIDATEFLASDSDVVETMLVDSLNEIQGRAMFKAATITPNDGRVRLKWSADNKKLYLRRRRGLTVIVR